LYIGRFFLINTLNPKKAKVTDTEILIDNPLSPYKDKIYLIFLVALALFGVVFVQYFSTVPLYYKEIRDLSELQIGLLLGLNGLVIFLFEMPLIAFAERKGWSQISSVIGGLILTGISFIFFFTTQYTSFLIVGMVVATLGEMIAFPFGNALALRRAKLGKQGAYMGLYSMSFSLSHIFGHNTGMQLVNTFSYDITWIFMMGVTLIALLLLFYVKKFLKKENDLLTEVSKT